MAGSVKPLRQVKFLEQRVQAVRPFEARKVDLALLGLRVAPLWAKLLAPTSMLSSSRVCSSVSVRGKEEE